MLINNNTTDIVERMDGWMDQGFVVMGVGYYLQSLVRGDEIPRLPRRLDPVASSSQCCAPPSWEKSSTLTGHRSLNNIYVKMKKILLLIMFCGSIVGAILLVGGLYSVLWGKSKEAKIEPCKEVTNKIDNPVDENIKQNYEEMLGEIAP